MDAVPEEVEADLEEGVQEEVKEENEAQAEEFRRAQTIKDIITQDSFEKVLTLFGEIRHLNSLIKYQEEIKRAVTNVKENSKSIQSSTFSDPEEHKHGNMPNPELRSKLIEYFKNEIKYYYKRIEKYESDPQYEKYIPVYKTKIVEFKEFITEINSQFEPEEIQKVKQRGTDILATVPLTQSWVEDEGDGEGSADESNIEPNEYRINSVNSSAIKGGKSTVEDPKFRGISKLLEQKTAELNHKREETLKRLDKKVKSLLKSCSQLEELQSKCEEISGFIEDGDEYVNEIYLTKIETRVKAINTDFKTTL